MNIWEALKFSIPVIRDGVREYKNSRYNGLRYKNNGVKNFWVNSLKVQIGSYLYDQLNKAIATSKYIEQRRITEPSRREIQENLEYIINLRSEQQTEWGKLEIPSSDPNQGTIKGSNQTTIYATDIRGDIVRESMILYYDSKDETFTFSTSGSTFDNRETIAAKTNSSQFTTNRFFHIDLTPDVAIQSGKNLVLTEVQGRDYTRKELVSGGDIVFDVHGSINSNVEGLYPTEAVKRFVKIMQYNGIVNVKSFQFNQLNVDKVIIKDFSLDQPNCMNIQPYSFSCVAIEPDEDLVILKDTISALNEEIEGNARTDSVEVVALENQRNSIKGTATINGITGEAVSLDSILSKLSGVSTQGDGSLNGIKGEAVDLTYVSDRLNK